MKASFLLLIIPLAVSVCIGGVWSQDSCDVDCTGKKPLDKVADPYNCTQFYFCVGDGMPTDSPVPCDPGTHFDPETATCTAPATCDPVCATATCPITCNGTYDMISDPFDCTVYYICYAGKVEGPNTCPSDRPFFDGNTCVDKKDVCCKVSCTPTCQGGIVQTPDPTDCHKYYICKEPGPVDKNLHFTCSGDEVFDYQLGRCIPGAPCTVLCPATTQSPHQSTTNKASTSGGSSAGSSVASSESQSSMMTSAGPTSDCSTSLTCTEVGNFAKCHSCQREYYQCTAVGAEGIENKCAGNLVFNTDPDYPYCVLPTNCPYHPRHH